MTICKNIVNACEIVFVIGERISEGMQIEIAHSPDMPMVLKTNSDLLLFAFIILHLSKPYVYHMTAYFSKFL